MFTIFASGAMLRHISSISNDCIVLSSVDLEYEISERADGERLGLVRPRRSQLANNRVIEATDASHDAHVGDVSIGPHADAVGRVERLFGMAIHELVGQVRIGSG